MIFWTSDGNTPRNLEPAVDKAKRLLVELGFQIVGEVRADYKFPQDAKQHDRENSQQCYVYATLPRTALWVTFKVINRSWTDTGNWSQFVQLAYELGFDMGMALFSETTEDPIVTKLKRRSAGGYSCESNGLLEGYLEDIQDLRTGVLSARKLEEALRMLLHFQKWMLLKDKLPQGRVWMRSVPHLALALGHDEFPIAPFDSFPLTTYQAVCESVAINRADWRRMS